MLQGHKYLRYFEVPTITISHIIVIYRITKNRSSLRWLLLERDSRGLAAAVGVAAFPDGFGLFTDLAEGPVNQTRVALPPTAVFSVLDTWGTCALVLTKCIYTLLVTCVEYLWFLMFLLLTQMHLFDQKYSKNYGSLFPACNKNGNCDFFTFFVWLSDFFCLYLKVLTFFS